jgi:hypothetical protein
MFGGNSPRLVAAKQVRLRTTSRLIPTIDVSQRLSVDIADDEEAIAWGSEYAHGRRSDPRQNNQLKTPASEVH